MRIVLDTNVIVSALLVQGSIPDQVLDTVISGRSILLVDGRIMQEHRNVLERPEFGFEATLVADLLSMLSLADWVLPDPLPLDIRDPDDLAFLEVAVAGGADAVVTGNVRDFTLAAGVLDVAILTPRGYIELLAGRTTT
jgi:uncharacterized protein